MSNINVNGCVSGTSDFSFAYNKERGKNKNIIEVIFDPLLAVFFCLGDTAQYFLRTGSIFLRHVTYL